MSAYDYLIVGSGMAGLTVGSLLANSGRRVLILEAHDAPGGYAHSFDMGELSQTREVEFQLGRSKQRVSVSSRLFAPPGRSFSAAGATLAEDYLIFALDLKPKGVRVLEPDRSGDDYTGERVRLLGVPASIPQNEDDIFGTIRKHEPGRIELVLDVPADLRGWGGAPVLLHPSGKVVGIVEAAWPDGDTLRIGAAPLDLVLPALQLPLSGSTGIPFASLQPSAPTQAKHARAPAPRQKATPSRTAKVRPAPKPRITATSAPVPNDAIAVSARRKPTGPADGDSLLGKAGALDTELMIKIEHPTDGTIVGDANGVFLAGRALALLGEFKRFDVVFVLDTSGSSADMTGADINGNGIIGQGGLRGLFGKTDPGDSILAAEVMAARQILQGLDARNTRVGVISFAGRAPAPPGTIVIGGRRGPAAVTEEPLTTDFARVEKALNRILERGPDGLTNMAEAVDAGWQELTGIRGGLSTPDPDSEKIMLFFTDGQPTLPFDAMFEADNVRAVLRAAERARKLDVRIHSFAIGPEALEGPVAAVEMASRTGGYFTPVRHPGDLVEVIENVSFANIEEIEIRNLKSDALAKDVLTNADGSFSALVPVESGRNRIQVRARASDGSEAEAVVTVDYAPGAPPVRLPRELVGQRNRLLEKKLVELRRGRMEAERARTEETRKDLRIEIEREREAARARAEEQRKQLDLEVLE